MSLVVFVCMCVSFVIPFFALFLCFFYIHVSDFLSCVLKSVR